LPIRCEEGKAKKNQDDDDDGDGGDYHCGGDVAAVANANADADDNNHDDNCDGDDHTGAVDPDKVNKVGCCKKEELDDELLLPQCGVFYCARERRRADVDIADILIPCDVAWLCMCREEIPGFLG
jgi:hypothetical protein